MFTGSNTCFTNLNETTRMPLTGFRLVHVPGYTYRRRFTIKDKPDPKPRAKKAPRTKAPKKRRKAK